MPIERQVLIEESNLLYADRIEDIKKRVRYIYPFTDAINSQQGFVWGSDRIYDRIVRRAVDHLISVGFKSVTVPASGGADSTFMLCILQDAAKIIRNEYGKEFNVFGFTLPCTLQDDADHLNDMGAWSCELYADDWAVVDLGPAHANLMSQLSHDKIIMQKSKKTLSELAEEVNPDYSDREYRVDKGNIAARLRMIFSYGIAKRLGGAPCSTDNLSEGLCGFWTLCGDEGTFKYIQNIFKGIEQPFIMKSAGIPTPFIVQKETDGLGVGDGDTAQLFRNLYSGKETYLDVDIVLANYIAGKAYPDPNHPMVLADYHPVVRWHKQTDFKRNPFTLSRTEIGLPEIPGLK